MKTKCLKRDPTPNRMREVCCCLTVEGQRPPCMDDYCKPVECWPDINERRGFMFGSLQLVCRYLSQSGDRVCSNILNNNGPCHACKCPIWLNGERTVKLADKDYVDRVVALMEKIMEGGK